jgi:hypothetical protein
VSPVKYKLCSYIPEDDILQYRFGATSLAQLYFVMFGILRTLHVMYDAL